MDMIRLDLHNHFTTKSRVLDPARVVERVRRNLWENGICGLVNYDDRRYETLAKRLEKRFPSATNLGNAIFVPGWNVYIVKGEEVRTTEGNILLIGVNEGTHPKHGVEPVRLLEENADALSIAPHPYFLSNMGEYMTCTAYNLGIADKIDAIEVHNGLAGGSANRLADNLYQVLRRQREVGKLASSDGHSFREVGSSYTKIPFRYGGFQSGEELVDYLRQSLKSVETKDLRCTRSFFSGVVHAGILAPLIICDKIGIRLSRGDSEALLPNK